MKQKKTTKKNINKQPKTTKKIKKQSNINKTKIIQKQHKKNY